jgi:eukaryotic-like serine/threonine-protein kinase
MTSERLSAIEEIFHAALDCAPDQLSTFLDTRCAGDEVLRGKVEKLLAAHRQAESFIKTPIAAVATSIVENGQADVLVGQTIGHYRISKRIGTGGMGEVYLASDVTAGRNAALKLLPMRFTGDAERLKRFQQEAHAVVGLNHPNVLTVYEVGQVHSTHYIASELIEGETLRQRLARGPMQLGEAVEIAIQVASALAAAHHAGIIHRDVKPENIMLRPDGYVKVLDFGIAKLAEQEVPVAMAQEEAVKLVETNLGSILGTVRYMSPEQARGASVDKRTDIWSLGAVLYEMVSRRAPFTGGTPGEVMAAILATEPPPLSNYTAQIPGELQQIVNKALGKDPEKRYQSANEMLEALKGLRHKLEFTAEMERSVATRLWLRWTRSPTALVLTVLAGGALALALSIYWLRNPTKNPTPEKSIAVLPFENLSEEKANAYFTEGIQNEILTKLATVHDLKVISHTSTAKYKSKPENLKAVAQELGVSTVLEGAVQRADDKVRVNVQLIDARADTHLWAKSYDRDLKDVLAVESEVSEEIAEALQANLSPGESHAIGAQRTPDTQAYDLFLRGEYEFRQAQSNPTAEAAYDRADVFYRQALVRDPNFVEAAAELAQSQLTRHWFVSPLTVAHLDEVKSLIDHALALAPNSPEAHLALGLFFYWGHRQYENALTEFKRTLELQPNNALARLYCALVYRRRGEWERSLADTERAQELDPRDPSIAQSIGVTYTTLRLWKDAERAALRALAIDPHYAPAVVPLSIARLNGKGDPDSARRAFDEFPEATKGFIGPPTGFGSNGNAFTVLGPLAYIDVIQKRFTDAFQALENKVVNNDIVRRRQLAGRAILRVLAGQTEAAKAAGEEALPLLEARLREQPGDSFAMTELSWVYLALGRNADALRISKQAADSMPIEKDALFGPSFQIGLAEMEARTGAPEEAVKRLRRLLSIPAGLGVSIARLKIDPIWDPIRNRPDFQQLLSVPEQIGPNK